MSPLDWTVVSVPLLIVLAAGLYTQTYVKSVADFVAANRSARRYLLCIGGSELQAGAVVFVAVFEAFSHGGFAYSWWGALTTPVAFLLAVSGFVYYRFRETRAMTLAQFFELRYNKSFRLFTGLIGFLAGLLNFGIIPAVGSRVMVYFLGLPETVLIFSHHVPTYVPLMAIFLTLSTFVSCSGGVVTIMVINTLEGILSNLFYVAIIFTVLMMFTWSEMHAVLVDRIPGQSMVNPFDTAGVKDFNLWTVLMALCTSIIATTISWQNASAYKSAALSPHESRMAALLNGWQNMGRTTVIVLLALAAFTYLHHPHFAAGAAQVQDAIHHISNKQAQEEMETPIALANLLPIGIKGLLCAVLLMGIFGGDATHLHSWGSVFIQDVLVPLRKKRFEARTHLRFLRGSIILVACFAFLFGTFFHLSDYITMWWAVTQAIFTGGAGSAIIGGLYWKKGTSAGAWSAFLTGSLLSFGGIIARQIATYHDQTFALNGVQIGFFSSLAAVAVYIIVSLLTHKEDFDLDRMLHRGAAAAIKLRVGDTPIEHQPIKPGWSRYIGIDDNFTKGDKWIAGSVFGWSMFWFFIFVIVSIWNVLAPWSTESWANYYHVVGIGLPAFIALVTAIWFAWGGFRDMRDLFHRLRHERVNFLDDGTVIDNQNLDELQVTASSKEKAD